MNPTAMRNWPKSHMPSFPMKVGIVVIMILACDHFGPGGLSFVAASIETKVPEHEGGGGDKL